MKKLVIMALLAISFGVISSCSVGNSDGSKPLDSISKQGPSIADSSSSSGGSSSSVATTGSFSEFDIYAGQTILVGKLIVSNDADNLYVTYNITSNGILLNQVHLWVGNDLSTVPINKQGVPVPGLFPYVAEGLSASTYSFVIPFSNLGIVDVTAYCGLPLYIFAHSALNNGETGWSFGTAFSNWTGTERWGWYSTYIVNCDNGPPEPVFNFETAFAKGNYVFTTEAKSNPENLPSLNLTRNRWGWAINIADDGQTSYDIYAGAGLNKTENGTKVGTLTVIKTAMDVNVTYSLLPGFKLEEVHVYAGDTKPTTLAPGQYGNTVYFNPLANTYSATYPVTDLDGDGIWLIAHSVVGIPK